jgi:hypothetical protein
MEPGSKKAVSAGINTIRRKDTSKTIGSYSNFDTNNRFRYYQQLSGITSHVSIPLAKLGLSLIKDMTFEGPKALVKDFNSWSRRVNFLEQAQTMARLLCRDGVYISSLVGQNADNCIFYPLLMSATTLLPDGVKPGDNPKDIMQPPAVQIVLNEKLSSQKILKPDEILYAVYNAWDSVQLDGRNRETFGLYGSSLLDPIELSIRNLLNINAGYVSFVKKYGMGRYQLDFKLLALLVEKELLDYDDAQKAIDEFIEKHKNLSENEDIASFGIGVIPIDAKGSLNVQDFKDSLEVDIALGLLQNPITMGKTAGSTYASGYVAEEDRFIVLEGLQKICNNVVQQMINRRLSLMKKPEDVVTVKFTELSQVALTADQMQEMYNTGVITKEQFLKRTGFELAQDTEPGAGNNE